LSTAITLFSAEGHVFIAITDHVKNIKYADPTYTIYNQSLKASELFAPTTKCLELKDVDPDRKQCVLSLAFPEYPEVSTAVYRVNNDALSKQFFARVDKSSPGVTVSLVLLPILTLAVILCIAFYRRNKKFPFGLGPLPKQGTVDIK
jgi:hypothetical protein